MPVLAVVADDDVITLDHTITIYNALAHGQLASFPAPPTSCTTNDPNNSPRSSRRSSPTLHHTHRCRSTDPRR
jgi:hypothetical protein